MADEPQDKAPEGLEHKAVNFGDDKPGLEYRTAGVPHENRTGTQLTEDEAKGTAVEGDATGITTESAGEQSKHSAGRATRAKG